MITNNELTFVTSDVLLISFYAKILKNNPGMKRITSENQL